MSTEDFHAMEYTELHHIAQSIQPERIQALAEAWETQANQHRESHQTLLVGFQAVVQQEHQWTGRFADTMVEAVQHHRDIGTDNADTANTQVVVRLKELAEKAHKAKSMVLAQGDPTDFALLKPREQRGRIDAAAQALHEYYGSLGESPVPTFEPFKTHQSHSSGATPFQTLAAFKGQPAAAPVDQDGTDTSSAHAVPVDEKQTKDRNGQPQDPQKQMQDQQKEIDRLNDQLSNKADKKSFEDKTAGDFAKGCVTGAIGAGVAGAVSGPLDAGAIAAGCVLGGTLGAAGDIVDAITGAL